MVGYTYSWNPDTRIVGVVGRLCKLALDEIPSGVAA